MKKWSIELVLEKAKEFKRISDFKKRYSGGYSYLVNNNSTEILRKFYNREKIIWWNFDKIFNEALNYKTKKEFREKAKHCYDAAYRLKFIDRVSTHMKKFIDDEKRCVYVYEFENNVAYVGLSYNKENRYRTRLSDKNDCVYKYMINNNNQSSPKIIQLCDYVEPNQASKLEVFYIEKYKNDGWNLLNKMKGGGLGGFSPKWTYNVCKKEALKFTNKHQMALESPNIYNKILKKKWFNELCSHFILDNKKPTNYWNNKENCILEAKKYNSKSELIKNNSHVYLVGKKNGWYGEMTEHMILKTKPYNYWNNKENCINEIKKYKTIKEFAKNSRQAYYSCLKNKWDDELYKIINLKNKRPNYWTKERLINLINNNDNIGITDFKNKNGGAFWKIKKIGLFPLLKEHFNKSLL